MGQVRRTKRFAAFVPLKEGQVTSSEELERFGEDLRMSLGWEGAEVDGLYIAIHDNVEDLGYLKVRDGHGEVSPIHAVVMASMREGIPVPSIAGALATDESMVIPSSRGRSSESKLLAHLTNFSGADGRTVYGPESVVTVCGTDYRELHDRYVDLWRSGREMGNVFGQNDEAVSGFLGGEALKSMLDGIDRGDLGWDDIVGDPELIRTYAENKGTVDNMLSIVAERKARESGESGPMWSWSLDGDIYSVPVPSREEAIEGGLEEARMADFESFCVGRCSFFDEDVIDADSVLDRAAEIAGDMFGEFSEGWLSGVPDEDVRSLGDSLNDAFRKWLRETGNSPRFFYVSDEEEFDVEPVEGDDL